jgi:hypothetical protein
MNTELGHIAVRKAAKRGHTTYGLAGSSQLLAAVDRGWLRRDRRYTDARYTLTPDGKAVALAHGWLQEP